MFNSLPSVLYIWIFNIEIICSAAMRPYCWLNKPLLKVRKFCLQYGASLFYTSVKEDKNCDLLYKYLVHRIFNFPFKVRIWNKKKIGQATLLAHIYVNTKCPGLYYELLLHQKEMWKTILIKHQEVTFSWLCRMI